MNKPQAVDIASHPLSGLSLIEASAGTGKTWTITHLYLRALLQKDFDVRQILVVTFTNAATQELKNRIRSLSYQVYQELASEQPKKPELDAYYGHWRGQQGILRKLQQALINFDEAAIFSIHGFCQRVLNSFPVETQALLQQEIIADETELKQAALRDFWRRYIVNRDISELQWILEKWKTPEELLKDCEPLLKDIDAIRDQKEPLIDLNDEWQSLMQCFNKDREAIEGLIDNSGVLKFSYTNSEKMQALLQTVDEIKNTSCPFELPKDWVWLTHEKLLKSLYAKKTDERTGLAFFKHSGDFIERHAEWLHRKKKNLMIDAALAIVESMAENKKRAQVIAFDDLIDQLSAALQHDNGLLQGKITSAWPLAMVDEFQDTDHRQYHIFSKLYQHDDPALGLIMIGDPKQAIYRFRGADVFSYQQARKNTSQHYTLDVNYRSSAAYIDMANRLFEQHPQAFVLQDLIEFFPSKANNKSSKTLQDKRRQQLAPLVCWMHPFSQKPVSKASADAYFAQCCASEIAQLLTHKNLLLDGKPVQACDLAILVKTGHQASLMKRQLAQLGISSALVLRDSVFESEQARELTLLLEVLIEPSDVRRLSGLLSTDLFGWDAQQIYHLQTNDTLLVKVLEQIKSYQQIWIQQGILSMFFKLLEDQQTLANTIGEMDGERQLTNWLHIIECLQQQAAQHASLSQALHWLRLQRQQAGQNNDEEHQLQLESDSDLVRIVTIHKSKGLQYPVVFLPFMWSMKQPQSPPCYQVHDAAGNVQTMLLDDSQMTRWQQENLAEEVRLFYVAITRAIYRSYLGWGNISGAGRSALAHCLYPETERTGKYKTNLKLQDDNELLAPFQRLNDSALRVEIQQHSAIAASTDYQQAPQNLPELKKFEREVRQNWRIGSYSQLVKSGVQDHFDRPDYDAIETTEITDSTENEDVKSRFNFHKGAKAGNFLHDILQHQQFDGAIDETLIRGKCEEYGFDVQWLPCLAEWMEDVLHSDLDGFSLSHISSRQRLSEMEFYMSCSHLHSHGLNRLLFENGYSQTEQAYPFSTINGFLKGFIDLVFVYNGQYFIADYKSNYLGDLPQAYDQQHCQQAMIEHHYHLQYLIYTLALHRYLQQRLADYDYQRDFGGVYYLFLRGMSASNKQAEGVFYQKPAQAFIEKLDSLLRSADG